MALFLEVEEKANLDIAFEDLANITIEVCLHYIDCPYEVEVNLIITSNEEIEKINSEQRKIDAPTDVLSFPMIDYEKPGKFDFLQGRKQYFNPDNGELILGDIIISAEKIIEQAESYGHSLEREYTFLIAHSMLHLFGYDHMDENTRVEMEQHQNNIMRILGISRGENTNKE